MSEKIRHIKNIDTKVLYDHPIILCDSSFIRCKNLPKLREVLKNNPGSMVVIPEEELQKGSSGHAKAEILASFAEVHAIIGSPEFSVKKIIDGEFGEFHQLGSITFSEKVVYDSNNEEPRIEIPTTNLQEDINFMKMTNDLISQSNCWWKPNGCIAVRDSNLIVSAVSTNPWCTDCKALSMNSSEVNLKKGERLNFCDSTHAERIVVAKAAKTGTSLEGSKIYVTSCPCEECAKVLIESGVSTVVFGNDSYGLKDASLLINNKIKLLRVKS